MKPIVFNTDMVCAILNGTKTSTRRVIKPQPENAHTIFGPSEEQDGTFEFLCGCIKDGVCLDWVEAIKMPYQIGDILYIREAFFKHRNCYYYKADGFHTALDALIGGSFFKWRPSIHMPKEAARIFLQVTDVRAERLQDIDDEGAKSESANFRNGKHVGFEEKMRRSAIERFTEIWDGTIKKKDRDRYGWEANPWVWVIDFQRISRDEAENEEKTYGRTER